MRRLVEARNLPSLLNSGRVLKEDSTRRITILDIGGGTEVFIKLHHDGGLVEILKRILLGSRARRSHYKSELLREHHLPGPASLGFVDIFDHHCRASAHFSELLPDSRTLAHVIAENPDSPLIEAASKLIAALHQSGLIHGDLKLTNLMVSAENLFFVDLDGLRRSASARLRARDIARFLVGLAETDVALAMTRAAFTRYCEALDVPETALRDRVIAFAKSCQKKHLAKYQRPTRPIL